MGKQPIDWTDGRSSRNKYATEAERLEGYRKRGSMRSRRQRANYTAARHYSLNPTCTHGCGCEAAIVYPVCGLCQNGLCDE